MVVWSCHAVASLLNFSATNLTFFCIGNFYATKKSFQSKKFSICNWPLNSGNSILSHSCRIHIFLKLPSIIVLLISVFLLSCCITSTSSSEKLSSTSESDRGHLRSLTPPCQICSSSRSLGVVTFLLWNRIVWSTCLIYSDCSRSCFWIESIPFLMNIIDRLALSPPCQILQETRSQSSLAGSHVRP